jgi:hypothetical protein
MQATGAGTEFEEKTEMNCLARRPQPHVKSARITARISASLCVLALCLSSGVAARAQQLVAADPPAAGVDPTTVAAPDPQPGSISGTVTDMNDAIVPGATVALETPAPGERRTVEANDNGFFDFAGLKPGTPYHVTVSANGFVSWTSSTVILSPGQFVFLTESKLKIAGGETSVTVYSSPDQIAVEQVRLAEQQRVFGFVPNFYTVYDPHPVPLTKKLKYSLAFKAATDPVTFTGMAVLAGSYQASNRLNYGQGWDAYGQRLGAIYADTFSGIMIGGAVLPSLLHQDPRYYYQGSGTTRSRLYHAISSPFVAMGDNGHWQPNYSSVGGDLASGAIANAYYPEANRGPALLFQNFAIASGGRMFNAILQEFVLRRFTPGSRN